MKWKRHYRSAEKQDDQEFSAKIFSWIAGNLKLYFASIETKQKVCYKYIAFLEIII